MSQKFIIPIILLFLFLLVVEVNSDLPPSFITTKTCSDTWGASCNASGSGGIDDAFGTCDGTEPDDDSGHYIAEVYINASTFLLGDSSIKASCEIFGDYYGANENYYMFYYNGSTWMQIANWTDSLDDGDKVTNYSAVFKVNNTVGEHRIRCAMCLFGTVYGNDPWCADDGCFGMTENDDVNFTVTDYLKYSSWNLTNYTTGATILDGVNLTRKDKINASAKWNKDLDKAFLRHNGNGTFQNYSVPITGNWTNYTLDLSNGTEFTKAGLINISYIWANDTFGLENYTYPSHYFYLWGNSKVGEIYINQSIIYNNTGARIFCNVFDYHSNLSISGYNVSFYNNDTFLGFSYTNSTGYANLSYTFTASTHPSHLNLSCNITDSESLYYNASSENFNSTILEVVSPGQVLIGDFWFTYLNDKTDKTNLYTDLFVHANVSDTLQMESVTVNLTYPNNVTVNLSMSGNTSAGWHEWQYTFDETYPLNMTGNYTVGIIAKNANGVENKSNYMTFYVNDTYNLHWNPQPLYIYMRGENISLSVTDVTNKPVINLNWTVNITKNNVTHTESNLTEIYTYQIKPDDPPGNYSIFANASKNGNSGIKTFDFNVSNKYEITNTHLDPSSPDKGDRLYITLEIRHNGRGTWPANLTGGNYNITCYDENDVEVTRSIEFTAGKVDYSECYAINEDDKDFTITINVLDDYGNSGNLGIPLKTAPAEKKTGGGGGITRVTIPPENCTDNIDNDNDDKTDCADEDCFYHPTCIGERQIPGFNFTLSPTEIEILQGENGTVVGTMTNTGDIDLNLSSLVDIEKGCCLVDMRSTHFLPNQTTSASFPILIHVNASTISGEYVIDVKLRYTYLQNSQSVKVIVKDNPIIAYILKTTPPELTRLLLEINEYENLGLNVAYLKDLISRIQTTIENAKKAAQDDNLDLLNEYNNNIKSDIEFIQAEKTKLAFQKLIYENKWNITYGIIIGTILTYMITRILYPFVRLSHEIVKISFEKATLTKSREQAEKQYFLRKIDEQTFRRIVTEKHSQILKLGSTVDLKKQQRINLLKRRLNPLYLGEYIKTKISKKTESKKV